MILRFLHNQNILLTLALLLLYSYCYWELGGGRLGAYREMRVGQLWVIIVSFITRSLIWEWHVTALTRRRDPLY